MFSATPPSKLEEALSAMELVSLALLAPGSAALFFSAARSRVVVVDTEAQEATPLSQTLIRLPRWAVLLTGLFRSRSTAAAAEAWAWEVPLSTQVAREVGQFS